MVRLLGCGDELPLGMGSRGTGGHSAGRSMTGKDTRAGRPKSLGYLRRNGSIQTDPMGDF